MTPDQTNPPVNPSRYRRRAAISLLVSGGLLALIMSRLDRGSLASALTSIDPKGLLASLVIFGVALTCVGLRWTIALGLARVSLPGGAKVRAVLGGHCLNMLLFGPAGGDVAKSAAWSRWYGVPIHELLVTAIMDRSIAALATVAFLVLTIGLMIAGDVALPKGVDIGTSGAMPWILGLLALGLLIVGLVYRFRHSPFFRNMGRSLRSTLRAAAGEPRVLLLGAGLGLCGQVLMSLAMGASLWAVTDVEVAWLQILWAFPLITAVAALPTSFGGAGVREAFSIILLSRYGIPAADLVAAGLVYLVVQMAWAAMGALALGWEERRFLARS